MGLPRARPFLTWAGGKGRLLPRILPHVPERFTNYHEPFLGSGAVFFEVRERMTGVARLGDLNDQLLNTWLCVRDDPSRLSRELRRYVGRDDEEDYYEVRGSAPEGKFEKAARFVYLNQTAWNGLWRVNRFGTFNVPWGARPFRGLDSDLLESVSQVLRGADVAERDFRDALEETCVGDFVYLDPPYLPVSDTSKFSGYTRRRFRRDDLADLSELCHTLTARGVHWVMSNRDTPLVRDLFGDFEIVGFTTRRGVAAQNKRNVEPARSPEVLVVGGSV